MQTATTQQSKKVLEAGFIVFLTGLGVIAAPFIINYLPFLDVTSDNAQLTLKIVALIGLCIAGIGIIIDQAQERRKKSLSLQR